MRILDSCAALHTIQGAYNVAAISGTILVPKMVKHFSFSCDRPTIDLAGPALPSGASRNPITQ
jgi:hypothetical protein